MSDFTYPADVVRAANAETFRKQAEIDRLRTQNEALRWALRGARAWVEHSVAPIRALSPAAAAPGDELLREIDAALAPNPA